MPYISNQEMKESDIPAAGADLRAIGRFAETFDAAGTPRAAALTGPGGRELLMHWFERFRSRGELPDSLSELRACLLMEWAVLPYLAPSSGPSVEQMNFLAALTAGIRKCIRTGKRD